MNDLLRDSIGHNSWANKKLLAFCQQLTGEQLQTTIPGVYGSILKTFQHILDAERGYGRRLTTAEELPWPQAAAETEELSALAQMADELGVFWERYLNGSAIDPDRLIIRQGQAGARSFEVSTGIVIAQIVHHGSDHRSQICTILSTLGFAPPEYDVWSYGEEVGRFKITSPVPS